MVRVSKQFKAELKTSDRRAYQLAQLAGVNPTTLSKLLNGIEPVRANDDRILRIARLLGLKPEEAFTEGPRNEA
jgi:transcriptional regulator with XRE-family HTH domain